MASDVQICNMALTQLGARTITALTDQNSFEATICNLYFEDTTREVISEGQWTSTTRRASLAKTTNTPAFEYANEFQLPTNPFCLKVFKASIDGLDYKIEGDKLVTDDSTVSILYAAYVTATGEYNDFLKDTISAKLSYKLAYPLTGDRNKVQDMFRIYQQALATNLAKDNQQGSSVRIRSDFLTKDR
jgi:hypothetical protein